MTDIQTRPASPFLAAPPPSPNPVSADDDDEKDRQATIGEHYLKAVSPATLEKALAYFVSQEAAIVDSVDSKDKSSVLSTVDAVPATKNIELLRASLKYNRKTPVSS